MHRGTGGLLGTAGRRQTEAAQRRRSTGTGRPFLGICVGLQLLYEGERGVVPEVEGLGVIAGGRVTCLTGDVKRPQMQWNRLDAADRDRRPSPDARRPGRRCHGPTSCTVMLHRSDPTRSQPVTYGDEVCAAEARSLLWACQFHPEKSSATGLRVLENFVGLVAR